MLSLASLIALIPGAGSLWGMAASALGFLVRCKPCLYALGTAALCGWVALHVHQADVAACDGRLEGQRQAAAAAAEQRDIAVKADLEKSFKPAADALRALNLSLQEKVKQYEKRKPAKGAGGCKLGDAAGLLQPPAAGKAAGAAPSGIADYLRRHFDEH